MKGYNREILEYLRKYDLNSQIIKDTIRSATVYGVEYLRLYHNYRAEMLRVNSKSAVESRPNNILTNDFRGEIVDQKIGYSFGVPVTYTLEKPDSENVKGVKNYQRFYDSFNAFVEQNKLASFLDIETAKFSSISGTAARLLYLDENKNVKVAIVPAWEAHFIYDPKTGEPEYAIRYYKMFRVAESGEYTEYYRVEWYDNEKVYFFNEISGEFVPDTENPSQIHGFKKIPLIEFPNNAERLGDFKKVESLIDAYDFITSFNQDELEEFRNAYIVFQGVAIDAEFVKKMRELGGIELPDGADAKWLIKELAGDFTDAHLKRLKENIYRFSKTVDMSDENFSGGTMSGEARKWKLKALADDAKTKQRYFENATRRMFDVLATYWELYDIPFEQNFVNIKFTENLPADLEYEARTTSLLKGNVSEMTRLGLLSFVSDPEAEMQRMEDEGGSLFSGEGDK